MDFGTGNAEIDLRERTEADAGISSLRLTVAALPKVQEPVGVEPTARPSRGRHDERAGAAGVRAHRGGAGGLDMI